MALRELVGAISASSRKLRHQRLVEVRDRLDQLLATPPRPPRRDPRGLALPRSRRRGLRRSRGSPGSVTRSTTPRKSSVFAADRKLNPDRVRAETGANHLDRTVEVRADTVHLVDERKSRVLHSGPPDARPSRLCGSTPATPQKTPMAPSSTRSERSTSIVKSTWPGVSMMLMR